MTDEVASLQDVSQDLLLGLLIPFDQEAVLDWLKPSFDSGKKNVLSQLPGIRTVSLSFPLLLFRDCSVQQIHLF